MPLNPWAVGQQEAITIQLTQESKTVDLTSVALNQISVVTYSVSMSASGVKTYTKIGTSTGVISVQQNKPGIIQWTPAAADVAIAGTYAFRVLVGAHPFDYIDWTILV